MVVQWLQGAHDWTHHEEKNSATRAKRHWGVAKYPVEDMSLA